MKVEDDREELIVAQKVDLSFSWQSAGLCTKLGCDNFHKTCVV